jgi:hypothetical protein
MADLLIYLSDRKFGPVFKSVPYENKHETIILLFCLPAEDD